MPIPRIAVIDDDKDMAELIGSIAGTAGYDAVIANDFATFRDALPSGIDMVVVDLNMPDVDGIEVLRYLAAENFPAGVILVSGFDVRVLHAAERLATAQGLRLIGSLAKPFAPSALHSLLAGFNDDEVTRKRVPRIAISRVDSLRAVAADEFVVLFQPKVNLRTLAFTSVEALVRWQHPKLGLLGPDSFIPIAESAGLIDEITKVVMDKAFAQCAQWLAQGLDLKVSVNISSRSLNRLDLPDSIATIARRNGIAPAQVILEITESWLSRDAVAALDILTRFRLKGFELSIDDFGTGYSNMQQLTEVPFCELKLDKSFVQLAPVNEEARMVVDSSVALGHRLNLRVVAEGVEKSEEWTLVSDLGCDECQGYLVARPMRGYAAPAWNARWQEGASRRIGTHRNSETAI